MNREEVGNEIVNSPKPYILAELPTSFGKSKIALDRMAKVCKPVFGTRILIVIPRLVLIENWKEEFKKWGYEEYLNFVEFVTYVSFPKKHGIYTFCIFDEAHHLSERCRESLPCFALSNAILLSATVGRDLKKELLNSFRNLQICKVSARAAIQEEILPDPKVFLIPLKLDNSVANQEIVKNKSQKVEIKIPYSQRFNYNKVKNRRIVITCTQQQYYDDLTSLIAWYKRKSYMEVYKNLFLRKSGERLKWLSEQKTEFIKKLLSLLQDQRTLTFCNGIPQTEELGKYCINSKNGKSNDYLNDFNKGKINHITACNMLDEGVNLTSCKIGIYAVLNSSERMITQKLGRLLRHPNPVIIIPYYVNTRDEELVIKMMENYNPELVTTITNLNQLTL